MNKRQKIKTTLYLLLVALMPFIDLNCGIVGYKIGYPLTMAKVFFGAEWDIKNLLGENEFYPSGLINFIFVLLALFLFSWMNKIRIFSNKPSVSGGIKFLAFYIVVHDLFHLSAPLILALGGYCHGTLGRIIEGGLFHILAPLILPFYCLHEVFELIIEQLLVFKLNFTFMCIICFFAGLGHSKLARSIKTKRSKKSLNV